MELTYTDEQQLFRETVRGFLADRLPPERLADIAAGDAGWDAGLWKEAVALGLAGVSVSEEAGGAGLGFIEETVAAEELGRGLFPGPWLGSVVLSRPALEHAPDLLAAVAAGDRITTVVGLGTPLASDGSAVTGQDGHVVDVSSADMLIVIATGGVFTADKDQTDWRLLDTTDGTRRLGMVALESTPATPLVGRHGVADVVARTRTRVHAALAAEAVGVASRAVELSVDYARDRRQFGRPIGSFQAVSHQIADAFMDVELARSLAMWAAAAVEGGHDQAHVAAATAKWFAAEAAVRACERAIQVHGGIGFTWEHLLHRCYKRAQWIESQFGAGADLRADAAAGLLR